MHKRKKREKEKEKDPQIEAEIAEYFEGMKRLMKQEPLSPQRLATTPAKFISIICTSICNGDGSVAVRRFNAALHFLWEVHDLRW